MSDLQTVKERNQELARQINEEALANPNSPYAGKIVGIAIGQVVVVDKNLDEIVRALENVEKDPQRMFIIEASRDYTKVVYIWSHC